MLLSLISRVFQPLVRPLLAECGLDFMLMSNEIRYERKKKRNEKANAKEIKNGKKEKNT